MSYTITVSGSDSTLSTYLNPPLHLDPRGTYEIALLNFETFYSIPNVDESNNQFHYGEASVIDIPTGTYEVADLHTLLKTALRASDDSFFIKPNNNTMKAEILCPHKIDFSKERSIGPLLGFTKKRVVNAISTPVSSDVPVNIFKVNVIRIECSIATGSFIDGVSGHCVYEFFPSVPPGYHISQEPANPIYLPVIDSNIIDRVTVRVVDQNGEPINFRDELISVRLHIRRNGDKF